MNPIKLHFVGALQGLQSGIEILCAEKGVILSDGGLPVEVRQENGHLLVSAGNGKAMIRYGQKIHFFRAFGLLIQRLAESDSFEIVETPRFTTNGAMLDMSRNAVMKPEAVRSWIRMMALMGLNLLSLYTEDTYEVEGESYFGYMRGRYSAEELKQVDDYADQFGIEVMPCIQTLAHLSTFLRWESSGGLRDTKDILLADSEATYALIRKMIASASSSLRSKRIHIGMDEAHGLGLGKYLKVNGYTGRYEIMLRHLDKVLEITAEFGLKPMMWSDMFFRLGSASGGYYDRDVEIPPEIVNRIPSGIQQVYWDYYHNDEDFYRFYIRKHRELGSMPVFAGGVWTFSGLAVNYSKTFITTHSALQVCKEEGVTEVFATFWQDDGAETNLFAALPGLQLYAEHGYSEGKPDEEDLKNRFRFCTGGDFDTFMKLDGFDVTPGSNWSRQESDNPSKFLLWQDVVLGLFDRHAENYDLPGHYGLLETGLDNAAQQPGRWQPIFEQARVLASVLRLKSHLGIRLKKAYDSDNRTAIQQIVSQDLPHLMERVRSLREIHRGNWFAINKSFGWEVLDIRYGGLLSRLDTAQYRLGEFLDGRIIKVEELEEDRLFYEPGSKNGGLGRNNRYLHIVTANAM